MSAEVPVDAVINVLQKLGDGEPCFDGQNNPIGFGDLAKSVFSGLQTDEMSSLQREVLYLRARLLNSIMFGFQNAEIGVYSPLFTLDTTQEMNFEEVFTLPRPWALLKVLSLLTTFPVLSEAGAARREALLGQAERLRYLDLPQTWPAAVLHSWVWMFCSYATRPDRHAIKSILNSIAVRWLQDGNIRANVSPRRRVNRPRLVVIAEVLKSSHVQYRYFARYLRQLRSRFELVIAVPPAQIDANARTLADEILELRITRCDSLATAVDQIQGLQPDIVFWLSVGMATWGPFLANLRFAHVQIAGLGHSASTFSGAIDYFLTEEAYVSDPDLFSEKLILLPSDSLRFEASPGEIRPLPALRRRPEPLRVAVPGNALKLNPNFINTLALIDDRASRSLEFVFFPNTHPTQANALKHSIGGRISNVRVLPRLEPNQYLKALSQCDIALSPFPFGGLHSTIDALSLGLPIVAMQGEEPHSRTDALVIRRLSLPEWVLTHTESDYVAAATRIIEDDALRLFLGNIIISSEPRRSFFGPCPLDLQTVVCDAVWATYLNHESIQGAAKKVWHLRDLLSH